MSRSSNKRVHVSNNNKSDQWKNLLVDDVEVDFKSINQSYVHVVEDILCHFSVRLCLLVFRIQTIFKDLDTSRIEWCVFILI